MKKEIIISGFGGQGVMSIGKNLVEAGMEEGFFVTWAPSYGPEMRGGTANCHVVLSTRPIGSPVFTYPTELIAMNAPSIEKFGPKVQSGGVVFINSSVVTETFSRQDVRTVYVPCEDIAYELGNLKVANMVMLGAYVGATGALKRETVERMIHQIFTGPKAKFIPLNLEALKRGMACVQ
ncbi:MAG: 2-oxoacid:acceptor oxidoreductase family protein [Oscillospiraceae bacterium]|nr:2-oxoacid:acceptor oxidoreductase family protein [Oscillospiraceae bacterium]